MNALERIKQNFREKDPARMMVIETMAYFSSERMKRKLPQAEFAKKIGIEPVRFAKLEAMDVFPTLEDLAQYAKGLGLSLSVQVSAQPSKETHSLVIND